ncbi:class I SAM-dependent methyltransferase, partial [Bacillus thuringiensis]|nr:class I SAM-dependent methyltransferase [Bacillus thuringiensis]
VTFGVEVDAYRYGKAKEELDVVVCSDFESMMISHVYFPLIFLNPPYYTELRTEYNKSYIMEFNFLKSAHLYLQDCGI